MTKENEIIPQLFRNEFAKMVAVISRQFGLQNIAIAEDIVAETFLLATETWGAKGVPENPAAWLYTVAKNKTYHHFKRNKIFDEKIAPELKGKASKVEETDGINFSMANIRDSQLQMMFAVCNPIVAGEAQIGLALRILCGFGIDEIAEAFLSNKETINKRLFRAREKLRDENVKMEMPADHEIGSRLDNVLHIIYLLFTEGYYSSTQNQILRNDLCLEAMRLGVLLTEFEKTNLPKTNALMALMCYHASRFRARRPSGDSLVLYADQDKSLWDKELIYRGNRYLINSASGDELSSYHFEARIAYWHCQAEEAPGHWKNILQLYDQLMQINYSPSVALNRTYALYKAKGPEKAIEEAEKLKLENNYFYFTLLGELYRQIDTAKAKDNFQKAYQLAKTEGDKQVLLTKIYGL